MTVLVPLRTVLSAPRQRLKFPMQNATFPFFPRFPHVTCDNVIRHIGGSRSPRLVQHHHMKFVHSCTASRQKLRPGTISPSAPLQRLAWFSPIYEITPVFPCNPGNVTILDEPQDFYGAIERGISTAKRRIVLASLYLGAGEGRVRDALKTALTKNKDLEVHILLDYFRGTRGPKDSSVSLLSPLVQAYPERVKISLYHTPAVGSLLKRLVPPRFIEGFGLQHMKIYIFDDDVLLSGANLNTDYFVDRQDRYVLFRSTASISDFYADLVRTVSRFSYSLVPGKVTTATSIAVNLLPPPASLTGGRVDRPKLKRVASSDMHSFCKRWHEKTSELREQLVERRATTDTIVMPMIQMGQLGVHQEESVLDRLLKIMDCQKLTEKEGRWTVHLSSGYLNFPETLLRPILGSSALYRILTASPEANGFFGSKGVSRYLPAAYTYLETKLLERAQRLGRGESLIVHEWKRKGWTFHAKGLWCTPPGESSPLVTVIGSSNFGYRSLFRDVEAQAVIATVNEDLRRRLQLNIDHLYAHSRPVKQDELTHGDRRVPLGVVVATRMIRTML
ncbi:CDP-diacylglycerol--glycerol-3-phosphate 3-phosphatidyltransferase [Spizellomyces punctatus DAOM BR117]|uniref:CDP-diacylglycerol--glycerol-3-phosphate 3-phosphatidyltransferase n=1 Tax=Spizellomyces punctatus (strain DAOM BR117) TaxID=645134 RepID=A0A0L0HTY2_SPIPD|nr:CDP-diacylglycerol--glycerol-3-phosphate 3-phosphatidyltransferase [Spizellomyces punctatus DAOM BR117]KND04806.1 hypothetical protein SPPG_00509 [Spizellomyces punctatus DAOM BR117]|eukprot:XP_016612845.1 hypothetical protein SPPG_00509 [Spizellomyces punctatus DAOM BR117]